MCLVLFLVNVFVFPSVKDDMDSVELIRFKAEFKYHLSELVRPVSSTYILAIVKFNSRLVHRHMIHLLIMLEISQCFCILGVAQNKKALR